MNLPTMSVGGQSFTINIAERVATDDPRAQVFGTGVTIHRPDDVRGDSVNQVMVGGRFDSLTEWVDDRRAQSDADAVSAQNLDIAEAQATHGVPVTEPVVAVAA